MRCAIALYQVMNPDSIGSYDHLICADPLPGDEAPEVWKGCVHDWAVARLGNGNHRFGMYRAAIIPIDEHGAPDEERIWDLIEQDAEPVEVYLCWSGGCELVEAS